MWRAGHRGRQTESKVEEIDIDTGVDMERGREKGKKDRVSQTDRGRRKSKHRNWGKSIKWNSTVVDEQ